MKKWVWHLTLAAASAFSALFVACSSDSVGDTAGSSFETENSVAMTVRQADGSPAARTKVMVRPSNFLAGSSSRYVNSLEESDSVAGIWNKETDDQGRLSLPRMKAGEYLVEARGSSDKALDRIVVKDSVCDTLSMVLKKTTSMSGQVLIPEGNKSTYVGIRGLDYVVQTDSLGNFEFKSLPEGSFDAVGFIYYTSEYVNVNGQLEVYDNFQTIGFVPVTVVSEKSKDGVVIGTRPQVETPDTLPADTTAKDSVDEDTVEVYPYVLLDDFDDGTYRWYTSVSRNATIELDAVEEAKFGLVAHMSCHKDSNLVWSMMGHNFAEFHDFSELDSVVFWARGENPDNDSMWVSFSFDVHVDNSTADSVLGYETGKAWGHKRITDRWTRIVITVDDLDPASESKIGGNVGWDAVKDHVNSLGIFAARRGDEGEYELWVDDVEIYGVKGLTP